MSLREANRIRKRLKEKPINGWKIECELVQEVAKYAYAYRPAEGSPYCTVKRDNVELVFEEFLEEADGYIGLGGYDEDYPERPDLSDTEAMEVYISYVPAEIRRARAHFKAEWNPRRTYMYESELKDGDLDCPRFTISIRPTRMVLNWEESSE